MENIMITIKYIILAVMEFAIIAMFVAVLVAAVYQIVRDKVLQSRRQDGLAQDSGKEFRPVLK